MVGPTVILRDRVAAGRVNIMICPGANHGVGGIFGKALRYICEPEPCEQHGGEALAGVQFLLLFELCQVGEGFRVVLAKQRFGNVGRELLEVVGGGLEGIEHKSGFALGDGIERDAIDNSHQAKLDGGGILNWRQQNWDRSTGGRTTALAEPEAVVVVAVDLAAHGGRAAAQSGNVEVLALWN